PAKSYPRRSLARGSGSRPAVSLPLAWQSTAGPLRSAPHRPLLDPSFLAPPPPASPIPRSYLPNKTTGGVGLQTARTSVALDLRSSAPRPGHHCSRRAGEPTRPELPSICLCPANLEPGPKGCPSLYPDGAEERAPGKKKNLKFEVKVAVSRCSCVSPMRSG